MRNLKNLNQDDAKKSGWDVLVALPSEVVGKAVLKQGTMHVMKSTKRFKVDGGYIYNTSTEIHKGAQVSVAEAICFVPFQK